MDKALRYNTGKSRVDLVPLETLWEFMQVGKTKQSEIPFDAAFSEYQKGNDKIGDVYYISIMGYQALKLLEVKNLNELTSPFELGDSYDSVASILTSGAVKYAQENWKKGLPFLSTLGSLGRHWRKWKVGQLIDDESGENHLGHVIVNAIFLRQYYTLAPWFDDRMKSYTILPKIALDLDDTVADFLGAYKTHYNLSKDISQWFFSYKTPENLKLLEKDKSFWIDMPVLHRPDFTPAFYISSREIPVEWSKEFLEKNNLPCKEVYHVGYTESKTQILKELGCQLFIDDKLENVIEAQKVGIASYLMDNPNNRNFDMGYRRVYDLNIKNILHT